MPKNMRLSNKHLAIDKANTQMVIVLAVAICLTVFCLVGAHSLWGEEQYQSRVIARQQKSDQQLKANIKAVNQLVSSYQQFVSKPVNIIGGSSTGSGQNDGDNAKIVLDALPSQYDFPGLTSSLAKIFSEQNLAVSSISGTDDELAQSSNTGSPNPQPVSIPFGFTITGASYSSLQNLISTLQNSIRPIQFDNLTLSGAANDMSMTVSAHTYYQPEKTLSITSEVVK